MKKTAPPPQTGRADRPSAAENRLLHVGSVAPAVYLVLSFVFFLPAFLPGQQVYGSDYLGGGYAFYHFISESLAAGALPKWVPYIFGGMPLFANPGSTYHPVHFLADMVVPTSRVLPVVFVVHFALAGIGMYLLARELGCRAWVAFVGGVAFQFTGILTSWVYAGHDGRIIVATLAPLFFYFLHRGIRTGAVAPFAGAALTLGGALLSFQIQNSYYLLLAGGIWAVFCLVHLDILKRPPSSIGRTVALGLAAVAFGFMLAAVNFLPFLGYVPESPRGDAEGRGYEYSISFSMPPGELLSVAVPEQHGASISDPRTGRPLFPAYRGANPFKLHTEYLGALAIILLALGVYYSRRDRYWLFFLGLGAFMLTVALGGFTPLYRLYYEILPGVKRFRAPSLSFYVVAFSVVAMATLTLERLAVLRDAPGRSRGRSQPSGGELGSVPWIGGGVVAIAVFGMLVAGGGDFASPGAPSISQGWFRFALFAGMFTAALWLWSSRRIGTTAVLALLFVLTLSDLWIIGRRFFHTVDPPEVFFAADDVVAFLQRQPQPFRVWAFPLPQVYRGGGAYGGNDMMIFGIDQVGGEHPVPLQRWNEFVGAGTVNMIDWHNFITGAQVVETAEGSAISFRSEAGFLEAANVRYLVSLAPLAHPSLREVHRGSALVYENVGALPRAFLVPRVLEVPLEQTIATMREQPWDPQAVAFIEPGTGLSLPDGQLVGTANVSRYEPDRVAVQVSANREALLVLADNHYDGWTARIDGTPAPIVLTNHTFRGVAVPAGQYTVEFVFRPTGLYIGLYITLAGFILLAAFGAFLLIRGPRQAPEAV